jgi:hypothetical protein
MPARRRTPSSVARRLSTLLLPVLAACATDAGVSVSRFENFDSEETHSRLIDASPARACEAARRALLSQGYVIDIASGDGVSGRKTFQPDRETHVELQMRVVCVTDGPGATVATLFVTGTEERYALKKGSSSASVGVGALGSVSLPFLSGDEALVRVGSQTITQPRFYDRFFALLYRHLERTVADDVGTARETSQR